MSKRTLHASSSSCPIANALDILGDQWTLLIIRDMLFGNRHEFHEFLQSDEGISTNILSDRLKSLVERKLIDFRHHPDNRRRKLYYLTPVGKDLLIPLLELSRWSSRYHGKRLQLPAEVSSMLAEKPQKIARRVLGELAEWEQKSLV